MTTTPPKLIALEGVGGSGKSSLAAPLARTLRASSIKRPLTSPPPADHPEAAQWMDRDCAAALALAHTAPSPYVILDRHWLSACVYQHADRWPACAHEQAAQWGEPDLWVIIHPTPALAAARLATRPMDGRHHLDDIRRLHVLAGRCYLYEDAGRWLNAPIVSVGFLPPRRPASYAIWEIRSLRGHETLPGEANALALADVVGRHVREVLAMRDNP